MKFYAIVFGKDYSVRRLWLSNEHVSKLLDQESTAIVYRCATDQIAVKVADQIVWRDIANEEFKDER